MAQNRMTVEIRVAWWLRPYLTMLAWFCVLHHCAPDPARLERVVLRALRVRVP
jgi:hypothetical protein